MAGPRADVTVLSPLNKSLELPKPPALRRLPASAWRVRSSSSRR